MIECSRKERSRIFYIYRNHSASAEKNKNERMLQMKKFMKITAIVMALALLVSVFASCGGGQDNGGNSADNGAAAADAVKGETQTWGNITVLVPEGMTLKGGNILDENNPDVVNISKSDNAMNYFLITINDDEDGVKSGIESTREGNDGAKDVTVDAGASWTGVTYEYSGMDVFQIYAEFDGRFAVVQSYGFAADSDTSKAILSSLKVAAKAD